MEHDCFAKIPVDYKLINKNVLIYLYFLINFSRIFLSGLFLIWFFYSAHMKSMQKSKSLLNNKSIELRYDVFFYKCISGYKKQNHPLARCS
jgi:hypothetical protein